MKLQTMKQFELIFLHPLWIEWFKSPIIPSTLSYKSSTSKESWEADLTMASVWGAKYSLLDGYTVCPDIFLRSCMRISNCHKLEWKFRFRNWDKGGREGWKGLATHACSSLCRVLDVATWVDVVHVLNSRHAIRGPRHVHQFPKSVESTHQCSHADENLESFD